MILNIVVVHLVSLVAMMTRMHFTIFKFPFTAVGQLCNAYIVLVGGRGASPVLILLNAIEVILVHVTLILLHERLTEYLVVDYAVLVEGIRAGHYLDIVLVSCALRSQCFAVTSSSQFGIATVFGNLGEIGGG